MHNKAAMIEWIDFFMRTPCDELNSHSNCRPSPRKLKKSKVLLRKQARQRGCPPHLRQGHNAVSPAQIRNTHDRIGFAIAPAFS